MKFSRSKILRIIKNCSKVQIDFDEKNFTVIKFEETFQKIYEGYSQDNDKIFLDMELCNHPLLEFDHNCKWRST